MREINLCVFVNLVFFLEECNQTLFSQKEIVQKCEISGKLCTLSDSTISRIMQRFHNDLTIISNSQMVIREHD